MIILSKDDLKKLSQRNDVSIHEILLLLTDVLKTDYPKLFFEKSFEIPDEKFDIFKSFVKRRAGGEPIAKIIQKKEFYGLQFKTTRDSLDPRPETELIVDIFRKYHEDSTKKLKILDLGSGTGCLGITLLKLYQNAECLFVDLSQKALAIAKENAKNLGVFDRSKFLISNWFEKVVGPFDVIVSNPPYVSKDYKLDQETLFDPEMALFAGIDGMDAYRMILPDASKYLNPNGILIIEIGFDQADEIKTIPTDLKLIEIEKDLSGIERACVFDIARFDRKIFA